MYYKDDWATTQKKFKSWWKNENTGRPLLGITAKRSIIEDPLEDETPFSSPEQIYLDIHELATRYHNYCKSHVFYAEEFPAIDLNMGAGSLALYLGTEPTFTQDTVLFKEWVADGWSNVADFKFNRHNKWFKKHLEIIQHAVTLAAGKFLVNIPDIAGNLDVLAAMRGSQPLCYDLADEPELIQKYLQQIDDVYFTYYDMFYNIVKAWNRSSSYTTSGIWGSGKTAKVQCDFSALMSPEQFKTFALESLRSQTEKLDHSIYHIAGEDAVKHLDMILSLEKLNAIQWTPDAGEQDGYWEGWHDSIYNKVIQSNKSLQICVHAASVDQHIENIDKLVNRFGTKGLYIRIMQEFSEEEATKLLEIASARWGN